MRGARYLSIYGALWKNSIIREMNFKANFILWIAVEMLWFALQLAALETKCCFAWWGYGFIQG